MKARKKYSEQQRAAAVAKVKAGASVREVAKELGCVTSMVYKWSKAARESSGGKARANGHATPQVVAVRDAIVWLKRSRAEIEKRGLKLDRDRLYAMLALDALEGSP